MSTEPPGPGVGGVVVRLTTTGLWGCVGESAHAWAAAAMAMVTATPSRERDVRIGVSRVGVGERAGAVYRKRLARDQ